MMRRLLRVLWPLAILLFVFTFRSVGCKGVHGAKENKKRWPTELTVQWTVPRPPPTTTIPPGVNVVPNPGE